VSRVSQVTQAVIEAQTDPPDGETEIEKPRQKRGGSHLFLRYGFSSVA
jgi:hypothetical protein